MCLLVLVSSLLNSELIVFVLRIVIFIGIVV